MKWIWPYNWYLRIRELEAQVAELVEQNRKLDTAARMESMRRIADANMYLSLVNSIASETHRHAQEARRREHELAKAELDFMRAVHKE